MAVAAVAVLAIAVRADAASILDPAFHFRTLTTPHFIIYFHQGEDHLAARLASIAEEEWGQVGRALGITAPPRTHVILADQSELANGWATPLPYNLIFVTAAAPPGSDFIGRTDDWLRLVFTHEFTHIVHLDRSEGWARIVRGIFGRTSIAFPNTWLPIWQIEGLAAWEESAITGEGRLHAGDFRAIEREAGRSGRVVPIDRVNGGLTDWPAGLAPYAFGLGFHDYLSQRFGDERFGLLAARTSRSLPFFGSRAFKKVYGESLGDLWKDYQRGASAEQPSNLSNASNPSNLSNAVRLTHTGFTVLGPRFLPPMCANCPVEIVYSVRDADGFPSLNAVGIDGGPTRQLALRYLGSTVGLGTDTIVFDQQQVHRNVGIYSDLYALDRRTGVVRAMTTDQRLQDPDLSPDGNTIVSVRQVAGRGELVTVRLPPSRRGERFGESRRGRCRSRKAGHSIGFLDHGDFRNRHPIQRAAMVAGWPIRRCRTSSARRALRNHRRRYLESCSARRGVRSLRAHRHPYMASGRPRDRRGRGLSTPTRSTSMNSTSTTRQRLDN